MIQFSKLSRASTWSANSFNLLDREINRMGGRWTPRLHFRAFRIFRGLFRPGSALLLLMFLTFSASAGVLTVGPDYKRPTNSLPSAYKATELGSWKEGRPLENVPKGNWWEVFQDPDLNHLETLALGSNQELKAAIARVSQARASARVARADLLPTLTLAPSYERQRYSPNQNPSFGPITANTFSVPLDLSYEIDIWGRVRRGFESARAEAQASLSDFYSALLTLQADVGQNYFALRSLEAEISTVTATVRLR